MRDAMESGGARSRLRSTCATGRPCEPADDGYAARLEKEIGALENGTHHLLRAGLADIQARKAQRIASAEQWRKHCIANIENEFDGAVKAAFDQYDEDVRALRTKLIDDIKRNRRRALDTHGADGSPTRKRLRPCPPQTTTTRSAAAIAGSANKPVAVKPRLSDDEIRNDIRRMSKAFTPKSSLARRVDVVRVERGALYVGNVRFRVGDFVECGRSHRVVLGRVTSINDTEIHYMSTDDKMEHRLLLAYLRMGLASIMHVDSSPSVHRSPHESKTGDVSGELDAPGGIVERPAEHEHEEEDAAPLPNVDDSRSNAEAAAMAIIDDITEAVVGAAVAAASAACTDDRVSDVDADDKMVTEAPPLAGDDGEHTAQAV
ncbi:Plus3 domain-containing protein [Plasmodiophora brassicae]